MQELLRIFRSVADPTRLRILRMLTPKPLCVCEVMSVLGMAQSTASKHLRILADAGLVEASAAGTWTNYRISRPQRGSAAVAVLRLVSEAQQTEQVKRDEAKAMRADRNRICRSRLERSIIKG